MIQRNKFQKVIMFKEKILSYLKIVNKFRSNVLIRKKYINILEDLKKMSYTYYIYIKKLTQVSRILQDEEKCLCQYMKD